MQSVEIAHWRMHNLGLTEARFQHPEDVVRWLGAVQSQDYGPAKWALGERVGTTTSDAALDAIFASGAILRTHVLRPTWHFVLRDDIRWMQELTAPRVHAFNAYYYRQAELDEPTLLRATTLITEALRDGQQLPRKQIAALLERAGIVASGLRLGYILMHLELNGLICSGALGGKQHTYALLEDRAPAAKQLTRDEALAELTRRYFTSHGPATVKDFRWWSSLTLADIAQGLALNRAHLDHATHDGITYWFAADSAAPPAVPSPTVHLLQAYDEYFVGYTESKYVLDASGTARASVGDRSIFNHVLILDSQVAGCWKRTLTRDTVSIEAKLYRPLSSAQHEALHAAASAHAAFLGLTARVVTSLL